MGAPRARRRRRPPAAAAGEPGGADIYSREARAACRRSGMRAALHHAPLPLLLLPHAVIHPNARRRCREEVFGHGRACRPAARRAPPGGAGAYAAPPSKAGGGISPRDAFRARRPPAASLLLLPAEVDAACCCLPPPPAVRPPPCPRRARWRHMSAQRTRQAAYDALRPWSTREEEEQRAHAAAMHGARGCPRVVAFFHGGAQARRRARRAPRARASACACAVAAEGARRAS